MVLPLVLLVQEASRQSSADLNKIKLYDFTVMESGENREFRYKSRGFVAWFATTKSVKKPKQGCCFSYDVDFPLDLVPGFQFKKESFKVVRGVKTQDSHFPF